MFAIVGAVGFPICEFPCQQISSSDDPTGENAPVASAAVAPAVCDTAAGLDPSIAMAT